MLPPGGSFLTLQPVETPCGSEAAGSVPSGCFSGVSDLFAVLVPADEKPYVCSLCEFVTSDSQAYSAHVHVQHPAASKDTPSPAPGLTSSSDGGYPKLKKAFMQGLNNSPHTYPSACSSPSDPSMLPVDLCVRAGGVRASNSLPLDSESLPRHKCSFCSHATRYPEVLWMHQTVAHRINSSSSNLAPKWAVKNISRGPRDGSLSSRRRTGPPPVLEGRECQPLPPLVRNQRTQPPICSSEVPRKSRPGGQAASSSSAPCASSTRSSSSTPVSQAGRVPVRPVSGSVKHTEDQNHRFRPKVYPRGNSLAASGSTEQNTRSLPRSSAPSPSSSAPSPSSSAPSPSSTAASRMSERYLMPQEGLGFMLSNKHSLSAEYYRPQGSPHQPPCQSRPAAISRSSAATQSCGTAQTHGGSSSSSSTSGPWDGRREAKQERTAEEMPPDILSFLKNYSPHELAALYQRWGAANVLLDPTGTSPRSARLHTCSFILRFYCEFVNAPVNEH